MHARQFQDPGYVCFMHGSSCQLNFVTLNIFHRKIAFKKMKKAPVQIFRAYFSSSFGAGMSLGSPKFVNSSRGTTFTVCANMCVRKFSEKGAFFGVRLRSEQI